MNKDTRSSVASIVQYCRLYQDTERVREALLHLSAAAIKEALAFYEANREEIDHLITLDEADGPPQLRTRRSQLVSGV